jgi:hypothetical protein
MIDIYIDTGSSNEFVKISIPKDIAKELMTGLGWLLSDRKLFPTAKLEHCIVRYVDIAAGGNPLEFDHIVISSETVRVEVHTISIYKGRSDD